MEEISSKLIDFSKLPNEMLSGVSTDTYNEITNIQWLERLQAVGNDDEIFKILEEEEMPCQELDEFEAKLSSSFIKKSRETARYKI